MVNDLSKVNCATGTKTKAELFAKNFEFIAQRKADILPNFKVFRLHNSKKMYKASQHLNTFLRLQEADIKEFFSNFREFCDYCIGNLGLIITSV